jgi:hypothetical protein
MQESLTLSLSMAAALLATNGEFLYLTCPCRVATRVLARVGRVRSSARYSPKVVVIRDSFSKFHLYQCLNNVHLYKSHGYKWFF